MDTYILKAYHSTPLSPGHSCLSRPKIPSELWSVADIVIVDVISGNVYLSLIGLLQDQKHKCETVKKLVTIYTYVRYVFKRYGYD